MENSEEMKCAGVYTIGSNRSFEKPLKQSLKSVRSVIRHYIANTKIVYGNTFIGYDVFDSCSDDAVKAVLTSFANNLCKQKIININIDDNVIIINSDRIPFIDTDVFDLLPLCDIGITTGMWFNIISYDFRGNVIRAGVIIYGEKSTDRDNASYYGLETIYIPPTSEDGMYSDENIERINGMISELGDGIKLYSQEGLNNYGK